VERLERRAEEGDAACRSWAAIGVVLMVVGVTGLLEGGHRAGGGAAHDGR
jgi:hypothetical protein